MASGEEEYRVTASLRDFIDSVLDIFQSVDDEPSCLDPALIRMSIEFNGETVQSGVFGVVGGVIDRTVRLVHTVTDSSQLPVELHYVNMKTGELLMKIPAEEAYVGSSVEIFVTAGEQVYFTPKLK